MFFSFSNRIFTTDEHVVKIFGHESSYECKVGAFFGVGFFGGLNPAF